MIEKDSMVLIKDTREVGKVIVITSEEICTIILENNNCCRRRKINQLEKIKKEDQNGNTGLINIKRLFLQII